MDILISHLRRELDDFRACLDGDLSAPVEHCGDWTLHDLADHVGRGNLWSAVAVTEKHPNHQPPEAPRERDALRRWFDETSEVLMDAVSLDPGTEAWSFYPPHTVAFWRRRRVLETLVHRWDAQHALGQVRALDPELAADGVAEVFDTMAPWQVEKGSAAQPAHALRLDAADTGGSWTYGPGEPVAVLRANAEVLLLMLWGRTAVTDDAITWEGDREAGLRVLAGPLVP
jgi:uncharacterized protein (TIGR03083 family)